MYNKYQQIVICCYTFYAMTSYGVCTLPRIVSISFKLKRNSEPPIPKAKVCKRIYGTALTSQTLAHPSLRFGRHMCEYVCMHQEVVGVAAVDELEVEADDAQLNAQAERRVGEHSQAPGALRVRRVAPGAAGAEAGRAEVLERAVQVLAQVDLSAAIYAYDDESLRYDSPDLNIA